MAAPRCFEVRRPRHADPVAARDRPIDPRGPIDPYGPLDPYGPIDREAEHVFDHARRTGAVVDRRAPVVLCLPAMGVPAAFYAPFAGALARRVSGTVVVADWRGQGTSELRAARGDVFGYRELLEEDLPGRIERLASAHPHRPMFLLGHSLGGQFAILAAARFEHRLAGVATIAAGSPHAATWPLSQRLRTRVAVAAIDVVSWCLPWYPGGRLGFGGDQPRRFMRDWAAAARTGHYRPHGATLDHDTIGRTLTRPVLSLAIEGDPIAPASAVEALLARVPHAPVRTATLASDLRQSPWRRHFAWARRPDDVLATLVPWMLATDMVPPPIVGFRRMSRVSTLAYGPAVRDA